MQCVPLMFLGRNTPDGVNAAVPQLRAQEGRVLLPGALPGGTGVGRVSRKLLILLVYIAVLGPTWRSSISGAGICPPCASNNTRLTVRQASAATLTGWRRAPQRPCRGSNTPAQGAPQAPQRPSAARFQTPSSYQSRPISGFSQA
jgi:hypothetical protein